MAKKKQRNAPERIAGSGNGNDLAVSSAGAGVTISPEAVASTRTRRPGAAASTSTTLPVEVTRGDWTVLIFSLMMVFAPGLGVPHEEMLQDTQKEAA